MYVFYPASQLVGLTINFREITQVIPFPPRNPSPQPEATPVAVDTLAVADVQQGKRKSVSPKRKSESPKAKSETSSVRTKSSDSPVSIRGRRHRPILARSSETVNDASSPVETRAFEKPLTLQDNLKNIEIYRNKAPVKRSQSFHGVPLTRMAGADFVLRDMTHPAMNDTLKNHHSVTFKLVKTVSEFTEALGQIYERHAEEMQHLVSSFRKKNSELRKERPACPSSLFHTWETLLQEVEIDSQAHSDIANILGRQVSRPLIEKSFHRKIQSRKVFSYREALENVLKQHEEKLAKSRIEYKTAYLAYMNGPSTQALANYINAHNEYVCQLALTNGMLSHFHSETLPKLLQEVEDVYNDLCVTVSESVLQGAEMISNRALEQGRRYEALASQCKAVHGFTDLTHLVRSVTQPASYPPQRRHFQAPQPPQPQEGPDGQPIPLDPSIAANLPPQLKNEIVVDRLATIQVRERFEAAKRESLELETQVKQLSDALHTLTRVQQRSLDSNLINKVNEIQEDISAKQYDLNLALLRLSAIRSQKELFGSKVEGSDSGRERKMSASSTGSMKSKWMKAFKSLKTPPTNGTTAKEADNQKPVNMPDYHQNLRKNQMYHAVSAILAMRKSGKETLMTMPTDGSSHSFQDYTYKKITPCDICSQVLRGHTRQGLKCKVCKLNVHVDCQEKAPKCQAKSRLLRRQKSTSEIDTKIQEASIDEDTAPRPGTAGVRQVHYDFGPPPGQTSPPPSLSKSRTQSQSNLAAPELDQVYQVLKHASDLSVAVKPGRYPSCDAPAEAATANPPPERTPSFERANKEHYFGKKGRKNEIDAYPVADYYPSSSPSKFKNRSDPNASLNNAACLGNPAGEPRRAQGPLLLTRGTTSLAVGPVPHATSSVELDTTQRRHLFSGLKSLSVFGGSKTAKTDSSKHHTHSRRTGIRPSKSSALLSAVQDVDPQTASTAPHSPRRQKLNLRMKSLSLDSPESTEQAQKRRAQAHNSAGHSSQSSSSKIHSPSSPGHSRRLLAARTMRMSSVELPDENERSLSSASTSPCPSPSKGYFEVAIAKRRKTRAMQLPPSRGNSYDHHDHFESYKPHRLLPTNLYLVLYNFKSRHGDELDLKAGYKVTVMDDSDPDWWKGKCLGRVGYFPSKYVIKLEPGEKPLQVTHNLQVQDGESGIMLLRDQIVIQTGEEVDGVVMIRSADNKQGACPLKFLQEV